LFDQRQRHLVAQVGRLESVGGNRHAPIEVPRRQTRKIRRVRQRRRVEAQQRSAERRYQGPGVGADTVHPTTVVVDDKSITFPYDMQDNGKTVHMRIVNTFTTPDSIDYRQEYSEDGQKWVTMATGVERRVSPKPK